MDNTSRALAKGTDVHEATRSWVSAGNATKIRKACRSWDGKMGLGQTGAGDKAAVNTSLSLTFCSHCHPAVRALHAAVAAHSLYQCQVAKEGGGDKFRK